MKIMAKFNFFAEHSAQRLRLKYVSRAQREFNQHVLNTLRYHPRGGVHSSRCLDTIGLAVHEMPQAGHRQHSTPLANALS